jgi:RiboL-PSP-HEPN
MASVSYDQWRTTRAKDLAQIAKAHAAVGGTKRGRRYATQQINHAYAVLLASQFQGFCRDLHTECVTHVLSSITSNPTTQLLIRAEFTRNRRVDRGNAQPASLEEDFGRFGMTKFWGELQKVDARSTIWKDQLENLNHWRNAIAHQDFDPTKLGGTTNLRLATVRRWHAGCRRLARTIDEAMRRQLQVVTGTFPW